MPRQKMIRRFEPRYGVSKLMLDEEAKAVEREAQNYRLLALSDLTRKRSDRHALLKQSWEHLQLLLGDLPDREATIIQCLLFRDLYHILELYITHHRAQHPTPPASSNLQSDTHETRSTEFRGFLFDL